MIKKIKFIFLSIIKTIFHDIKKGYDSMAKPKEVMNLIFYIAVVLIFTERWEELKLLLIAYVIVYIWKVIKQGDWRKMLKESNK